jgi:hypothetical protein
MSVDHCVPAQTKQLPAYDKRSVPHFKKLMAAFEKLARGLDQA